MSGPKSSYYYLSEQQRAALAAQRERELKRKQEELRRKQAEEKRKKALAQLTQKKNSVSSFSGLFEKELAVSRELSKRTGKAKDFEVKVKELEAEVSRIKNMSFSPGMTMTEITKKGAEIDARIKRIKSDISGLKQMSDKNDKALNENLDSDISKGYSINITELISVKETEKETAKEEIKIEDLSKAVVSGLEECSKAEGLSENTRNLLEETLKTVRSITDCAYMKNYAAIKVAPLIEKCEKEAKEYEECVDEYESLKVEYWALCEELSVEAKPERCSRAGITFLKEQIKILEEELQRSQEDEYIATAVNEVMSEMGYDVLGYRDSERHSLKYHHDLYRYSDGTAVDVTYSSDGQITMELGGIDSSDRIPNEDEANALCTKMESFCDDFNEIERRLAEKGVLVSERIQRLPPSTAYAQIINTNDYQMVKSADTISSARKTRASTEKKAKREEF